MLKDSLQKKQRYHERGFIVLFDEYQNTVVDGIYALGDVTGEKELTPVAIKAGHNERRIIGETNAKMDYTTIPTVFSHPAIGTVCMTRKKPQRVWTRKLSKFILQNLLLMYSAVTSHCQEALVARYSWCRRKVVTMVSAMINDPFRSCYQDRSYKSRSFDVTVVLSTQLAQKNL